MYQVAVRRKFIAQHFLIGGDWGAENDLNSHHYLLELVLEGAELDSHGYLVDIIEIEGLVDAWANKFRDKTLNDFPEFKNLNPSIEHFSRISTEHFNQNFKNKNINKISVKLWEHKFAWASYTINR